jgi:hypothetical protein
MAIESRHVGFSSAAAPRQENRASSPAELLLQNFESLFYSQSLDHVIGPWPNVGAAICIVLIVVLQSAGRLNWRR